MKKIRWGVLSTGKIGLEKVIPAMQKGEYIEINAIASRNLEKAQRAAQSLQIAKAYGSYEELLSDNKIDAVYITLPNHLHVEWTIKSLEAGKHVLCEKPVAMNFNEAEFLKKEAAKFPHLKVMEAFMYRHHPQTLRIKKIIDEKAIGDLKNIHSMFSYYNDNPEDIRNKPDIGGGGLLDIGCYCISLSRFFFADEPMRVCATIEYDPKLKTDRLVSAVLEFKKGTSVFTCSTQMENHQFAKLIGTSGKIEVENPFTPSPVKTEKVVIQSGSKREEILIDPCNHYTIQGDLFSLAILNGTEVPTPLADAVANMKVIDKVFESAKKGCWVEL